MKPEHSPFALFARRRLTASALATMILLCSGLMAQAGSATWKAAPTDANWNNSRNWTPKTIPNSPSDIASFGVSSLTNLAISAPTEVASLVFDPGASAYSISDIPTLGLTISGAGVENNSGITQNFIAAPGDFGVGAFNFTNGATAGSATTFTLQGGTFSGQGGGLIQFFGNATAGEGTFIVNGAEDLEGGAGNLIFYDSSTAGNGDFTLTSGTGPATSLVQFRGSSTAGAGVFFGGGVIYFLESANAGAASVSLTGAASAEQSAGVILMGDNASAGNASFFGAGGTTEFSSGAAIFFFGTSDAANSSLIASGDLDTAGGATIYFEANSSGGACTVEVSGRGNLDISLHDMPGVTIGALQGNGAVFLGANRLVLDSDNSGLTFAGSLQDGGINGGFGGSLTKIGSGTWTLSGPNSYTGGTTISGGTLLVTTKGTSATGPGPVQVDAGTLGGTSKLAGAITVGTGSGLGAFVAPGINGPGRLATQGTLTFNSDSTYLFELSSSRQKADQISAKGVTISGALFSFIQSGNRPIPTGTVFTVINNSSRNPIAGTFNNLPDGSNVSANGNNYQVSYEGGTGNDLTLTVVP